MSLELKALETKAFPNWCAGCGDFGIWMALKQAISQLHIPQENYVIVSGIGCGSKTPHWIHTFGFHSLHGRPAPIASGIRLANHKLTVIIVGGDGDGYGIGMGHFIHLLRRNYDLLYVVQNNEVYGLTTGQTSPTSPQGFCSISTPHGAFEVPVNPLQLAITAGATWVARAFAGNIPELTELLKDGIQHKGTGVLDVLQPCVTFNKKQNFSWYQKQIRQLHEDPNHDPANKQKVWARAEKTDNLEVGIFYHEQKPTYEDRLPQLKGLPLVQQPINAIDIQPLLERYR